MYINISPLLGLHEKGLRNENEDNIHPTLRALQSGASSRFFVVCDGVGGAEKGEEASRIVCETFAQNLAALEAVSYDDIVGSLVLSEYQIDAFIEAHPDANGMATTFAFVFFGNNGAVVAHIGDSRVYHLRKGEVLYKTSDHSLVNELVLNQIITPEEARNHPKRNVVSRAIMGRQRPAKPDIQTIVDIREGDYFFLCTDGILESVSDEFLGELSASSHLSDTQKVERIAALCQQHSKDNFSAFLIRVDGVETESIPNVETSPAPKGNDKQKGVFNKRTAQFFIVSSLIIVSVIFLLLQALEKPENNTPDSNKTEDALFAPKEVPAILSPIILERDAAPNPMQVDSFQVQDSLGM